VLYGISSPALSPSKIQRKTKYEKLQIITPISSAQHGSAPLRSLKEEVYSTYS